MYRVLLISAVASLTLLLASCDVTQANADAKSAAKKTATPKEIKPTTSMTATDLKAVETSQGPLVLTVSGAVRPDDGLTDLHLVIRLRNNGGAPLALLNGGTTQQPRRGVFFVEADSAGVVTLAQKAYALPDPAPTVPITPAATVLAAAGTSETTWQATLETLALNRPYMGFPGGASANAMPRPITKIRVCIAYKLFDEKSFAAIKGQQGFFMPIGAIDQEQSIICSPVMTLTR